MNIAGGILLGVAVLLILALRAVARWVHADDYGPVPYDPTGPRPADVPVRDQPPDSVFFPHAEPEE